MSSIRTISPASLHDHRDRPRSRMQQNCNAAGHHHQAHNKTLPVTPIESHMLSPYSSHIQSNTTSPTNNTNINTPADTISDIYLSEFSADYPIDPFFGTNFNDLDTGSVLNFFEGDFGDVHPSGFAQVSSVYNDEVKNVSYPISPNKTPATTTVPFFNSDNRSTADFQISPLASGYLHQAEPSTDSVDSNQSAPQLTPDTNGGSWSGDDSSVPAAAMTSPRLTVSMWNKDGEAAVQGVERSFTSGIESPRTVRASRSIAGDLASEVAHDEVSVAPRDTQGSWLPDSNTGLRGLAPGERPPEEVQSINNQAAERGHSKKNNEILHWVSHSTTDPNMPNTRHSSARDFDEDNIPTNEVPLGHKTENRYVPEQAYLDAGGPRGAIHQTDIEILQQSRNWGNAPMVHHIQDSTRYQPDTSQAAIERFNRQCHDTESIVSRAATWGTRRRSLPSIVDMEGIVSGNFLKKLSISTARRPSFMKKFPTLVRKPSGSGLRKRKPSNASEILPEDADEQPIDRVETKDSLAPPSRTSSWGIGGMNKKPPPSINTAVVGMAIGAAVIGTTHARSHSINATPVTSPKGTFGSLSIPPVKNTLKRPRSKTELPRTSNPQGSSHSHLVGMLKKQGGPPVAQLARSQPMPEQDDEDEDDDEEFDDADIKAEVARAETINPTLAGFQDHIIRLNPALASPNSPNRFLVDRIAHQMVNRYKQLQSSKIKHLKQISSGKCLCGRLCIALGGSAMPIEGKGGDRGPESLLNRPTSSDDDNPPLDGGISAESFPLGIPPPPTANLPAEFECQLCFVSKKFHKPSDWTKHVHEDVQPFTCTWEKCRDPKMFKRKADWVRHENEGHRHLEWWKCNVDDCTHTCFRRDNFLQHLVREHKFTEPKFKTKAQIKKNIHTDPTWQRVEQCHGDTRFKPQDEPCRFCNKVFPTWKKLTVHLAKHMEHISLPVLRLVAVQNVQADTVISPIQDLPPRNFDLSPTPVIKQDPNAFSPTGSHISDQSPENYQPSAANIGFTGMNPMQIPNTYYNTHQTPSQYPGMLHNAGTGMAMPQTYTAQPYSMPVTTAPPYGVSTNQYMMPPSDTEPFPDYDSLGIQDATAGMAYANLGNNAMHSVPDYGSSNQGSASPYSHSPHPGQGGGGFTYQ